MKVTKVPRGFAVAVSGGPDSMAMLHYFHRKHVTAVVHINHGTQKSPEYEKIVTEYANSLGIVSVNVYNYEGEPGEKYWRDFRVKVFSEWGNIATAHTLDDAVEWWILTSLRGNPKVMPYQTENRFKPFIQSRKAELLDYCARNRVPYIVDPTNVGDYNDRAKLRAIMPSLLDIYPGIYRTMELKYERILDR
jgi:tRNA(Ile)-lysidine synthase